MALLALFLWVSQGLAQQPAAKLLGTVRGPGKERLSGVRVRLEREGSPLLVLDTATDALGEFRLAGIPPGSYALKLNLVGMQPYQQSNLEIHSATSLELEIILSPIGGQSLTKRSSFHALEEGVGWGIAFSEAALDRLPNARNVWSILESQAPSTVTDRIDVGGLEAGVPALFGALGASWTENQYRLNGFDITDPYTPGRPLLDPDLDALTEFQVLSGAKPAGLAGSGGSLALTTTSAADTLHGATRLFYSGGEMQSDNLDARLRGFQFPGPERLNHLVDGNLQVGGKLPLARWPAFVSLSTQQLSKNLGGFGAPIDVRVYRLLTEFTPLSRAKQRLNVLYAGQHIFNSREGAELRIEPSAATRGNDNFHHIQARWQRTLSRSASLALGFGVAHAVVSSGIQPGVAQPSTLDLPLMTRSGPAPLSTAGLRTRYQVDALFETIRNTAMGSHSLDLGVEWDRSSILNRWEALGGIEQVLVDGVGAEIIRWNAPTRARQHVQNFAGFAQDAWRPVRWLRIPLGLRLETSSGEAAGANNLIRWTTVAPRAGLVLPLTRWGTVLRASWSRSTHLLQGRYFDFGNPAALGAEVFRWQDSDSDGLAQPQEFGERLRLFGGPYSAVDRGLARPFTDEISVGLEQEFGGRLRASVHFFRRDDHRLIALTNLGVPFSDYTPVSVLDPGNDGIPGTADDQVLTVWNRIPSGLGRDFFLLTNPPGDRASFKGFEIRLDKPLRHLWEFSASFSATQTHAPTSPGNSVSENDTGFVGSLYSDPNTLLYGTSRTYFDRAFVGKATGYYRAPLGFQVGVVAKYYDGLPFGRLLFVNGFNQGPFFVRATPRGHPGGFQTQFNGTLDLRVARDFTLQRSTLSGYFDIFNALNMNRNTLEADLTGPTFQSRVPLAIESPRLFRLGVEWKF